MANEDPTAETPTSADERVDFEPIEGETELAPPEAYAAALVEWAIDRRASDIFLSDAEKSVLISVRRLGRIEPVRRLAREYGHRLQGHFRVVAGSDAGEMRHPTEGRGVISTPNGSSIDLRLSSVPTLFGQDVAVRLFDPDSGARHLDQLGWDSVELTEVESLLNLASGLILVAGPVASGQLVLATIHAKTSAEAVDVMRQYGTNPKFLAGALIGVVSQRLIRRLCPHCRQPISSEKTPAVSKRLAPRLGDALPQLYRARGCEQCYEQGFISLTCLPEILSVDRSISDAIAKGASAAKLHALATRHGMLSLAESAQLRVYRGETTAAEASRAVSDPELAALVPLGRD